ncbi:site-specific tyrosine recombinase XerD [Lactobacillus intestinalis]|uniref:Site-specific tyrosine recombinase XerD n=2 Tax=Lactobacillus intestinalis TaxID=151781 RepID=A0A4S2BRN0_9LACO|nr:site-specific tyrosine recombinase XerD [Lactobacillus intestinalis]
MTMNNLQKQIEDYLQFCNIERGLSNNTIVAYRQDLLEFLIFLKSRNITSWPTEAIDIEAFLAQQHQENKAASSISRMISSLRKFYQWLARKNIQKLNPMIEIDAPQKEFRQPVVLVKSEVALLLNQPNLKNSLGLRDRALLETLYATGMKVSEAINLKFSDIHADLQLLKISSDETKERLIPISINALKWLKEYQDKAYELLLKAGMEDYVFLNNRGKPLTRQAVWQIIKRYAVKAQLDKEITPHTLRQSFAMQMLENGADFRVVQEILGRSNNLNGMYGNLSQKQILDVYQKTYPRI